MNKTLCAKTIADVLNTQLQKSDVQICNYSRRFVVKKGGVFTAEGDSIRVNGKGPAFLVGSFKAYSY